MKSKIIILLLLLNVLAAAYFISAKITGQPIIFYEKRQPAESNETHLDKTAATAQPQLSDLRKIAATPAEYFAEQLVLSTADVFKKITIPKYAVKPANYVPESVIAKEKKKAELIAQAQTRENSQDDVSEPVSCEFTLPEKPQYGAEFISVSKNGKFGTGELSETKVYIQNKSNVPWFSKSSGCKYLITNLGTDKGRDRDSIFFTKNLLWDSNWGNPARVVMQSKRVDPNQIAVFSFWSRTPEKDGYYREYFTPVIEGITWIDSGTFYTDYLVGKAEIAPENKDLLRYIDFSTELSQYNLSKGKSINVKISTQRMQLKIGDLVIREFPVSTGANKTPTPIGSTKISHKQEVRVSGTWPHYIMPKWTSYRAGGYGIHALPSPANDNGVFWTEALNHIGQRRSHGCIRLLPKDAEYAYNFGEIGTPVNVIR